MVDIENCIAVRHLVDALERMAFISALPLEGTASKPASALLLRIGFRGPANMRIEILTDEALGSLMAANVMGDCPDALFRGRDALKELLNVTCGSLLSQWPSAEGRNFEMSIPEVQPVDAAGWEQLLAEGDFALLDAEGHILGIRLADRK